MDTGKLIKYAVIAVLGFLALKWFASFAQGIAGQLAPNPTNASMTPGQPGAVVLSGNGWYGYGPYYESNPFYNVPGGVPWAPNPGSWGRPRPYGGSN